MTGISVADLVEIYPDRLKRLRKKLRLSGPVLSEMSGVSQATISRAENHLRRLSVFTFDRLCKALAQESRARVDDVARYLLGEAAGLPVPPIMDLM
jgi:transcriptional regulator with XRE-family HTH domain